ncbi:retron system putative HNH endonuclease [Cetobacterium sp. SF1]|uniref:retron system putative HNH endonuclease n=1 Tax=Cetobacterium sp. SF1 TaxID=3417654 RepID=UPI003CF7488D
MFKVNKTPEPAFFQDFKRKNKLSNWDEYSNYPEIKKALREYMLLEEQDLCCPYCEILIEAETSEIEHIKPKTHFKNEFQNYNNFLTGCKGTKICGNHKGNKYSENFINPTLEDPEDYFTYDIKTGKIIPKEINGIKYEKAKETIEILNLNDSRLCGARKTIILQNINNLEYLEYIDGFSTLKKFLRENASIIY